MATQSFQTPEPIDLEVRIPAGDVEVETVDGDESTVTLDGDDGLVDDTVVQFDGNRLRVVYEGGKGPFGITIAIGGFTIGRTQLRVRVCVPHESRVELSTASADSIVHGRIASLESKSASGDLHVEAEVSGNADVKTVSGDVRLRTVGGALRTQSVSGDLTAAFVGGDVTVKSVSGDTRIDTAREGEVTVQSVSGDIQVGIAPGTNLDVDAGSVSGDLTSEVPLGSEAGALGDGPMLVVRGKTVSGDFRVFRAA